MSPQRVEGIEIDRCLTCDGIWLDAGEYPAVRHRISIDRGETLPEKKAGVLGAGTPLEIVLDIVIGLLEILP